MRRQSRQPEHTARIEVRCIAVVFLSIAVVHSVLAAMERVAWPIAVAAICVAGALVLERVALTHGTPAGRGRDAAQRILSQGLAVLPGLNLAEAAGVRQARTGSPRHPFRPTRLPQADG